MSKSIWIRGIALALGVAAGAACLDKETGKGADTKAGEGARAGAPIGTGQDVVDGGTAAAARPEPDAAPAAAGGDAAVR
jgi:hypothetical protein